MAANLQVPGAAPVVPVNGQAQGQGIYSSLMAQFDASHNNALPGNTLFQQAVHLGGSIPCAYLFCGNTATGPKIYCLHLLNNL
jgi:hypothetical protein